MIYNVGIDITQHTTETIYITVDAKNDIEAEALALAEYKNGDYLNQQYFDDLEDATFTTIDGMSSIEEVNNG